MSLPTLYYSSSRGQCAAMLLAALHDLYITDHITAPTRREAVPSQVITNPEPRWQTLIAWSRKDSVMRDLISGEEWNAWGLTRLGRDTFENLRLRCESGRDRVTPCFLWSLEFKLFMCPSYSPSAADAKRPATFYKDVLPLSEQYRETASKLLQTGNWVNFLHNYREVTGRDVGQWAPTRNHQYNTQILGKMVEEYLDAKILNSFFEKP